jgi:NhaA family Na+:H+ antiporter
VGRLYDPAAVCLCQRGRFAAGVTLEGLTSVLPLGIIAGLFIGKPLGISLFCWLALKLKLGVAADGTTCKQIMAVGMLCGIGFTMSIFISTLAFGSASLS